MSMIETQLGDIEHVAACERHAAFQRNKIVQLNKIANIASLVIAIEPLS